MSKWDGALDQNKARETLAAPEAAAKQVHSEDASDSPAPTTVQIDDDANAVDVSSARTHDDDPTAKT